MKELVGTIKSISSESMVSDFKKEGFGNGFKVKTTPEREMTYQVKGRTVYCTIKSGNGKINVKGVARCHPEDIFNLAEGCGIAELRANQKFYKALENLYLEKVNNPVSQLMKSLGQVYED